MAEVNVTGEKSQQNAGETAPNSNEREVILSDGRKAVIRKGKGKDVKAAMRVADSDSSAYMFAMMAALTTIEGNVIVAEDLEEMDMKDVMTLQTEFAAINF